ncbi:hypothetical protein KDW49_22020 [Burkholderia dolosa]|uniref:hypothetical protein n=1 Tax=Burkholderia dolosa TaxID=152500 RepID=UPI001BA3F2C7|nr:hypothetical protein [Burkholderia dolosa]MBR8303387.1 hypothetical protein [Burkholderia dolosa]
MATYTPDQLIDFYKRGLRFFVTNTDGSFGPGFSDFGSAAKAGGLPTNGVAVVSADGSTVVHNRTDVDFFDFGKQRG